MGRNGGRAGEQKGQGESILAWMNRLGTKLGVGCDAGASRLLGKPAAAKGSKKRNLLCDKEGRPYDVPSPPPCTNTSLLPSRSHNPLPPPAHFSLVVFLFLVISSRSI